ncbi:MAG: hypothetical protein JO307_30180 [Bryobacterales bacterium]|nr:hypothetical protein [Bryobacterales bacterium]MBV9397104.1 hypothetical protein [Bryobacterales bacterium]
MSCTFRLFWLREDGCDAGTLLRADQLDSRIKDRVLELANGDGAEIGIRLPFFDKREWRRREELLSGLTLKRSGNAIVCSLPVSGAVRDHAAQLALFHPAWKTAPRERDDNYFRVWRSVSVRLQAMLRQSIAAEYFTNNARYEDREKAYPMLVYQTARLFHGRPPTDFAYDLSDYPECQDTLASTWKMTGNAMQRLLAGIESRLNAAGLPVLARRYAPMWYKDVLVAVQKKSATYIDLIARESMFINAVLDLGTARTAAAVNRFARTTNVALRKVYGMDVRTLALKCLDEATSLLDDWRCCTTA